MIERLPIFTQYILSYSADETRKLGEIIGTAVSRGTILALTGDLGSGKTAFVQGLAKGLDVPDGYYITSPSYTLVNEYPGRFPLFHIDLYRISDPMELEDIGFYEILNSNGVVAMEWADRIDKKLLPHAICIHFEITDAETHEIRITTYDLNNMDILKNIPF